jgi:hypothetical protein
MLQLTRGSTNQLSAIFPSVPHITRFDLAPDLACTLLGDAEEHLGAMSVPYVLAIHEEYLKTCLMLLAEDGRCQPPGEFVAASKLHGLVEVATGGRFHTRNFAIYETLREMRNCLIHTGGLTNERVVA